MLLIAGWVIILHMFIPHDHHYDIATEIGHHHNDKNSTNENPFHCHYFNNIDFDIVKSNHHIDVIKISPVLPSEITFVFTETIDYQKVASKTHFTLPYKDVLVHISPTRGSPLV